MRVVILGSGHGSNARAILESQKKGNLGNAIVVGIVLIEMMQVFSKLLINIRYLHQSPNVAK